MKKILFPTDFSSTAANAFDYAIALAKDLGAQIDLIHIYSIPFNDASAVPYDMIQFQMKEKADLIRYQFNTFTKGKSPDLINHTKSIYGIFPAVEILDFATNGTYDYVIMGMKGSTNRFDLLMGSIATRVIMKAPCPVIAVPFEAKYRKIEDIAYATTMEPKDGSAVKQLMEFAGAQKAMVHFVHINTESNEGIEKGDIEIEHFPTPFTGFTIINNYSVINGLNEYVDKHPTDLLALYIPHRRLWERIFHQSVTKRIALHTQIPLIVFHQ